MFSRLAILVPIAALVAVATASPGVVEARDGPSQCPLLNQYCCNEVLTQYYNVVSSDASGINLDGGNHCIGPTPYAQCSNQPACCHNDSVGFGCSPYPGA